MIFNFDDHDEMKKIFFISEIEKKKYIYHEQINDSNSVSGKVGISVLLIKNVYRTLHLKTLRKNHVSILL